MNAIDRLIALRDQNDAHAAFMAMHADRFTRLAERHERGEGPRAISAHQLFQTPANLAARMVALADPRPGLTWLEPSAGLGRLLRPILATDPANVTACEIDDDLSGELFREFPTVRLWQGDFLVREFHPFDRIVMNPPFHMRSDVAHVRHALRFLAPGGVMVGLCLAGRHREEGIRPHCNHWETIPAGTFRAEGTNVETVLFKITR